MIQTQVEAIIRGPPKYYFDPFFKQANVEKIYKLCKKTP